ncbi:hypothetical protein acdb102_46450 [Acidothermaceae bacterium B102]|nr:hypothetical protein acdb102_46450 [Acidothermaceae bacterium B102]
MPHDWYCTSAVQPGTAVANDALAEATALAQPVWASLINQTVSLPLAHFAPLTAAPPDVGAAEATAAEVAAPPAADVAAAAAEVAAAAAVEVAAALEVPLALVELELLPHAVAVKATAMPTDATYRAFTPTPPRELSGRSRLRFARVPRADWFRPIGTLA